MYNWTRTFINCGRNYCDLFGQIAVINSAVFSSAFFSSTVFLFIFHYKEIYSYTYNYDTPSETLQFFVYIRRDQL